MAQTRFQQPDTTADVGRYRTVEECLVAAIRTQQSAIQQLPVWLDTAESIHSEVVDSTLPAAVAIARQCSAKFSPDSVAVDAYANWMALYLFANRDEAAETVLRRRLAGAQWNPADLVNGRATILAAALTRYASAGPVRWKNVQSIGDLFEAQGAAVGTANRLSVYGVQFTLADGVRDTLTRRRVAERITELANTLTPQEQGQQWYQTNGRYTVTAARDFLSHVALLDSLRRNSTAYVALKRANWEQSRGMNTDALPLFIGRQAAPVKGDFWFAPNDSSAMTAPASRPTPGKVSLVVFLGGGCREEAPVFNGQLVRPTHRMNCWDTYAAMRRLAQKFPSLELTIAAQTTGYVGDMPPVKPADEAQVMRSWWLGFHRLPATLAVVNTPFFRLEEPDRRRIDKPVPNNVAYLFGGSGDIHPRLAYLVDVNGIVLHSGLLSRLGEREFREILEIVTKRTQ